MCLIGLGYSWVEFVLKDSCPEFALPIELLELEGILKLT